MEIFVVGVNPLLQQLEKNLRGIDMYKSFVEGPATQEGIAPSPLVQTGKVIGFVDDACPIVTSEAEFYIVDECLQKFELASGCKFHRNPVTQKCKIALFGPWKRKYHQSNIPLKFLQVTDHLDILGVKLYESWRTTQKENGLKVAKKVNMVADRWKSGRFYEFLLRPHIVNTYLFSNIWYVASVLDLQLGHLDEIQRKGNQYVHSDCFLKPQVVANYLPRDRMGLGVVHVKTKSLAMFIKNLLEADPETNCYLSKVLDHYCREEDCQPSPVKPQFLSEKMIQKIKLVLERCSSFGTKDIYNLLLQEEFKIEENFKFKVELDNDSLNLDSSVSLVTSTLLPLKVRNTLWKLFHNVIYDDILKGKIKNLTPICQLCEEVDIDRKHVYFSCAKHNGLGTVIMNVLQKYNPVTEANILGLNIAFDEPKLVWLICHYLYFLTTKVENIRVSSFKQYLLVEMEILARTKYCDEDFRENLSNIIISLDEE